MLLTRLYPYDPTADKVGQGALLRLNDKDLQTVLTSLESTGANRITARFLAQRVDGGAVEVRLDWRTEYAGFACSIEGQPAGFLPYDELVGAQGKPIPVNHRTCRVCLSAELDIWRSGLVDVDRGLVHVYTQRQGLAKLGAHAFLTDADGSPSLKGLYIDLSQGEPARGALRVPYKPLRAMQGEMGLNEEVQMPRGAQDAIDMLSELGNSVAQFQSIVRGGPKLG
ncbi:hypothetical protein [Stutzerimonas stutzeri]|uniref:hypothetical protein n=1 Tax=Stutzerimonas stutzeri TaxID=316 RepID=UPI0015E394AB|nr:hypothetical protein [Stutzerimonas stutzeri]MBA1280415.1 hypothetical protein [Stutzerimonas stutzeri]